MERRPFVIAAILSAVVIGAITVHTVSEMLAVPPMPPEMLCGLKRCPVVDTLPVAPLVAPRLSDIKPLKKPR